MFISSLKYAKSANCSLFRVAFSTLLWKLIYKKNVSEGVRCLISGKSRINVSGGRLHLGIKKIGFQTVNDEIVFRVAGVVDVLGDYSIGRNVRIDVGPNATLTLGRNGYINNDTLLVVMHGLSFGEGTVISWGCQFIDEDFHRIVEPIPAVGKRGNRISIGSNVWIGSRVTVLKGVEIADGCVIAAGSVVTKSIYEPRCLIAGVPARIIKRDIRWER